MVGGRLVLPTMLKRYRIRTRERGATAGIGTVFLAGTSPPFVVRPGLNTAGTLGPIRRDPPRPPKGLSMSENDPWKSWYQEPTPSDPPSADRTVSMPQPSNRPTFEPNPGSGGGGYGGGGGGYGAGGYGGGSAGGAGGGWGAQPPLVSPPGTQPAGA